MTDNERWNMLKELFPIQEMRVEETTRTLTKYGPHNNYNVYLKINGVKYKTEFHDSVYNYVHKTRSSNVDIFACIFRGKECADSVRNFQEFCEMLGYEIEELRKAQKVYRECKRTQQYFKKVLTPDDLEKISKLLEKWGY